MKLEAILEIENTPEILTFTCPGTDYLLWPFIRTTVLRMIIDREIYGGETAVKSSMRDPGDRFRKLWSVVEGMATNLHFIGRQAPIVFFSSGITNILVDGLYLNRVSDYFAFCYPDATLLIEDPYRWRHARPRVNQNVAYHSPLNAVAAAFARLSFRKGDTSTAREFIAFIESRLKLTLAIQLTAQQLAFLHAKLSHYCVSLKAQLYIYKKVYQRLNPTLIFFEDGHYGGRGHLIRLAKEMGIKTAEMQHGMISAGHDAYNLAPTLLESKVYQLYAPDYFLAYGQWWAERIHVPAQVVIIGNPHYDTMCRRWRNGPKTKNKILLLSDGVRFARYLEMAREIKAALPSMFEIIVRPHPMERAAALQTYGGAFEGIQIDDSDDLYQHLAESYAVIGEISTALFEAVGLAEKVFSFSNPRTLFGLPDNPFEQFETVEQLVDKLLVDSDGKTNLDIKESIWADNWESRYRDFITHQIGIEPGQRGAF